MKLEVVDTTAEPVPVIELHKVCKTYASGKFEVRALAELDLRIGRGEWVVVMGPSGSGKTTLLEILGCLCAIFFPIVCSIRLV